MKIKKFNKKQISKVYDSRSFYKAIYVLPMFETGEVVNVGQLKINAKTYEAIEKIVKTNWKKYPNADILSEKAIQLAQTSNLLTFMPKVDDSIPDWSIAWITEDEMHKEWEEQKIKLGEKQDEYKS